MFPRRSRYSYRGEKRVLKRRILAGVLVRQKPFPCLILHDLLKLCHLTAAVVEVLAIQNPSFPKWLDCVSADWGMQLLHCSLAMNARLSVLEGVRCLWSAQLLAEVSQQLQKAALQFCNDW